MKLFLKINLQDNKVIEPYGQTRSTYNYPWHLKCAG